MNTQDTGKFRTNIKDQFYTNEAIAGACVQSVLDMLPNRDAYLWVEPSAGSGSFLRALPSTYERIGLDLEPKADGIQTQDYLTWTPPADKRTIVFGNPPFGRQSSLAKTFIKKSCAFAEIVAFILPRSFTKPSMFNAFPRNFHLVHSHELGPDSFVLNGSPHDVPCVFQVWQKKDIDRSIDQKVTPHGFRYVKAGADYHTACRRVGWLAGRCYPNDGTTYSVQSHYFLQYDADVLPHINEIVEKMNSHTFPSNTVGPRSLSKTEVSRVLNDIIQSVSA
jgi:hypothetical protein